MSRSGDPAESQGTLAGEVAFEGVGLHSGVAVKATLLPAAPDTGLVFRRMDLDGGPRVEADVANVTEVEWKTVVGAGKASVGTIEHLLAPLTVHGVDNLEIRLEGPEPPALDGSSLEWCRAVSEAGVVEQDRPARTLVVREPFAVTAGDARYAVTPYDGYRVTAEIDFDHPAIGRQVATADVRDGSFCAEIAPARTFGLEAWRDLLHSRQLALGADYENTVVITADGISAGTELRYENEFVRHKILDIIGDLALVRARLRAHVVAERPSHRGNIEVARRLRRLLGRPADGGPVLDINQILDYIPHRYPFLLVDRIVEFESGKRIVGLKNVTINEPFFAGHFPDHPIMPGVLIIEAMAQAGGLLLMNEFEDPRSKVVYFMSLDDVKFRRPVTPGDQLLFELEMLQLKGRTCKMRGVGSVAGAVVAEATMLARVVDK